MFVAAEIIQMCILATVKCVNMTSVMERESQAEI